MAERRAFVVTCEVDPGGRRIVEREVQGAAPTVYLKDLAADARARALETAAVLLMAQPMGELQPDEWRLLRGARLIQFRYAGVDTIPLAKLPPGIPLASNGGAFAEPMAEHALAMALAAAKRLAVEHANLARGRFNQFVPNRMLAGGVCGLLGFGGIGIATARLMRALGMRIHAINRRGATAEPVDWIGPPQQLDALLATADVLVIGVPLTRGTVGMLGARELRLMKDDAIVVNLARGEIIDEGALYEHLRAHPRFTACIDAWWIEPLRHGKFAMGRPFFELPNVIGSPHNSSVTFDAAEVALRRAVANCRRALVGEAPLHLLGPDDAMA
jgi:phosphoglycerate dehydrogenase-like enzyme